MIPFIIGLAMMILSYTALLNSLDILRYYNLNDHDFKIIIGIIEETCIVVFLVGSILSSVPIARYAWLRSSGKYSKEVYVTIAVVILISYSFMGLVASLSEHYKAFSPYLILLHLSEYLFAMIIIKVLIKRSIRKLKRMD